MNVLTAWTLRWRRARAAIRRLWRTTVGRFATDECSHDMGTFTCPACRVAVGAGLYLARSDDG
jgi:hypothetical protein